MNYRDIKIRRETEASQKSLRARIAHLTDEINASNFEGHQRQIGILQNKLAGINTRKPCKSGTSMDWGVRFVSNQFKTISYVPGTPNLKKANHRTLSELYRRVCYAGENRRKAAMPHLRRQRRGRSDAHNAHFRERCSNNNRCKTSNRTTMIQNSKQDKWINESGQEIPLNYITPSDRLKERVSGSILRDAKSLSARLAKFKEDMLNKCEQVREKKLEELNARGKSIGSGAMVFYNFDKSIKVTFDVNNFIEFDDITLSACKAKLDEWLNSNLDSKSEFMKEIVMNAFSTSRGKIDTKKVLDLMKWRSKVKDALFQDAINLLADAIRRGGSRTYPRVWERDKNGEYKAINLNFSSI